MRFPTLKEFKSSPEILLFVRERFEVEWSNILEPRYRHEFPFITESEVIDEKESNWQQSVVSAYTDLFPSMCNEHAQEAL